MVRNELLALQGLAHSPQRHARKLSGFTVEYVQPELGAAFSYDWTSDLHFCAYHDIVLEDGGIRAGDGLEDNRRDLRHTLTYVPRGARVTGWSELQRRNNSFAAIYFDPAAIRQELDTRFATMPALRQPPPLGRAPLALIDEFIEENLGSDLSLSSLAALAGLSRFHFSRAFKASTGETPYQHVLRRRMERARLLLAAGDLPIDEIASSLGFQDSAYFQRTFKSWVGMSVKEFRDRM